MGVEKKRAADYTLAQNIRALGQYKRARSIGIYLARDGEPALDAVIETANRQGKHLFAPVLFGDDMGFARLYWPSC